MCVASSIARRTGLCVALLPLVAGCGSQVAGAPVAQPELWDPCSIPSEAIAAAGVDPTILTNEPIGEPDPNWALCVYRHGWFFLNVQMTTLSYLDVVSGNGVQPIGPVQIDSRAATSYRNDADILGRRCNVATPYEHGTVIVSVATAGAAEPKEDPCVRTTEIAKNLGPHLPD